MIKKRFSNNNIQFDIIFKPVGDILTIELDRITQNDGQVNLIEIFQLMSKFTFEYLEKNNYRKVGFIFMNTNPKWIECCKWIISKKIKGEWIMTIHPNTIFCEKIN
jgi:hypothetical protein